MPRSYDSSSSEEETATPTNKLCLVGLHKLFEMNPDKVERNANLEKIEKKLLEEGSIATPSVDVSVKHREKIDEVMKEMGLGDDDIENASVDDSRSPEAKIKHAFDSPAFKSVVRQKENSNRAKKKGKTTAKTTSEPSDVNIKSFDVNFNKKKSSPLIRHPMREESDEQTSLDRFTEDEKKKKHVDIVLSRFSGKGRSTDDRKRKHDLSKYDAILLENERVNLYEEIQSYYNSISSMVPDFNVDLPTYEAPIEDLRKTNAILRQIYQRSNSSTMFEEGILLLIGILENIFDGKTTYFGKYTFDLTGFSNTAYNKLSKLRPSTSSAVANFLQSNGIGLTGRLLMELGPSLLLYASRRKTTAVDKSLSDASEVSRALTDLAEGGGLK